MSNIKQLNNGDIVLAVGVSKFNEFLDSLQQGVESQATAYGQVFETIFTDPAAAPILGIAPDIQGLNALGNFPFGDLAGKQRLAYLPGKRQGLGRVLYSVKFSRIPDKQSFAVHRGTIGPGLAGMANVDKNSRVYPGLIFGALTNQRMDEINYMGIRFTLTIINPIPGTPSVKSTTSTSGARRAGQNKQNRITSDAFAPEASADWVAGVSGKPSSMPENIESFSTFEKNVMDGVHDTSTKNIILTYTDTVEQFENGDPSLGINARMSEYIKDYLAFSLSTTAAQVGEKIGTGKGGRIYLEAKETIVVGLTGAERAEYSISFNELGKPAVDETSNYDKSGDAKHTFVGIDKRNNSNVVVRTSNLSRPSTIVDFTTSPKVHGVPKDSDSTGRIIKNYLDNWGQKVTDLITASPFYQHRDKIISLKDYQANFPGGTQSDYDVYVEDAANAISEFYEKFSLAVNSTGYGGITPEDEALVESAFNAAISSNVISQNALAKLQLQRSVLSTFRESKKIRLTKKQLRRLLERAAAGEVIHFPPPVPSRLENVVDERLNRFTGMSRLLAEGIASTQDASAMIEIAQTAIGKPESNVIQFPAAAASQQRHAGGEAPTPENLNTQIAAEARVLEKLLELFNK